MGTIVFIFLTNRHQSLHFSDVSYFSICPSYLEF
ncbi:hypothetical protein BDI4_300068 [Burkholderia diffusa]|nr:hypothetical protein BDI4_300068 [Burkholderia diffusa]